MSDASLPLIYRILRPFEKNRLKKTAELIKRSKLSVLEIGCSDGRFLYENKNKWKDITGVDTDKNKLKKASQRVYGIPSNFYNIDFGKTSIPFPENNFDIIISIATLQYIYDLDLLFSEVFRVLKKGGLFIFEVPNLCVFWRRWQLLWGILPKTSAKHYGWDSDIIHYFTYHDLKKFVMDKGFTIERVSCSGILDSLRQYWTSLFGGDIIFVCRK